MCSTLLLILFVAVLLNHFSNLNTTPKIPPIHCMFCIKNNSHNVFFFLLQKTKKKYLRKFMPRLRKSKTKKRKLKRLFKQMSAAQMRVAQMRAAQRAAGKGSVFVFGFTKRSVYTGADFISELIERNVTLMISE